jgi:hypothetical protein
MGRNLVYTLALDLDSETGHRNLAKLLVSSLLRTRFSGDILVFHNSPAPLFMVSRQGVREVQLDVAEAGENPLEFMGRAQSHKHAVASHIDTTSYDRIMFIDCDAVVMRNIDHLLAEPDELMVFSEPGTRMQTHAYGGYLAEWERMSFDREGFNSGTWAVAAPRFGELLARWRAAETRTPADPGCMREQSAFNRVVLDWDASVAVWPHREIALPLCNSHAASYHDYTNAAIVHAACGHDLDLKLRFLFSVFAGAFLFDPQMLLFNILEM